MIPREAKVRKSGPIMKYRHPYFDGKHDACSIIIGVDDTCRSLRIQNDSIVWIYFDEAGYPSPDARWAMSLDQTDLDTLHELFKGTWMDGFDGGSSYSASIECKLFDKCMYYDLFVKHCKLSKNHSRIDNCEDVLAYYGEDSCTWLCLSCAFHNKEDNQREGYFCRSCDFEFEFLDDSVFHTGVSSGNDDDSY